ncbi:lanthionine synthetase LanC family protein [Nonomuraea sp. NPDC049269]|uniref:lanthionine synthetase LanC family protein n=1 Tax=Nonomuraea sp. NPDC049269 TaxID=3364349 RepID=UPI0037218ED4
MSAEYRNAAGAALAAGTVSSGYELAWFGDVVDTIRPLPEAEMMREAAGAFLSRLLYRGFYLFGWPRKDLAAFRESMLEGLPSSRSARFINAAVYAAGDVPPRVVTRPVGEFRGEPAIDLDGVLVRLDLDGSPPDTIEVRRPYISITKSPGFVLFRGPAGPPSADGQRLVRLYWNVTAGGAIGLVSLLSRELGELGLCYEFKVIHADAQYLDRADTAVLYMGHLDLVRAWSKLREIHARLLPNMRPYVPALTRKVGLGLALAEDPGGGNSYGMFVCEAIAGGAIQALVEGRTEPAERLEYVANWFADAGRSLDTPYASEAVLETVVGELTAVPAQRSVAPAAPSDYDLLGQVDRIAARIARGALVQGDRCTWLKPHQDEGGRSVWTPMEADLYGGTAGMALFFAHLADKTGDRSHAELALAASRQTLDIAAGLPGEGLYSGVSGAGLAVVLAGKALGDSDLAQDGCALVIQSAQRLLAADGPVSPDVVEGVAGALIAMLGADALGGQDLVGRLGDLLVRLGTEDAADGLCWLDALRGDEMGFIGFAHGASGCGLALGEAGRVLGEQRFLDAAERAFRYERHWFDQTEGDWRDVRSLQERGKNGDPRLEPDVYRHDWCYGAPGIGLARTALLLPGDKAPAEVVQDARIAFAKTARIGESFPQLIYDSCLCHGAAGIADALSLFPAEFASPDRDRMARELTHHSLMAYHDDLTWPAGHGLMLGAAGVAHSALRRLDPAIVSPLLPLPHRPEASGLASVEETSPRGV